MSSDGNYILKITVDPKYIIDADIALMRLRREWSEAAHFFDEAGDPTGKGGSWRSIVEDLSAFTAIHPGVFVFVEEEIRDYDHKARYYAKGGRVKMIQPVLAWPEFSEDML